MQGDKSYTVDLLKLALNTQKYVYELERNDWFCSEKRKLKSVFERDIKIIWAGASVELEEKLIPVRIPIFKGLTSYRVLLIRRSEQVKFSKIQTLSDFKLLSLGQAEDWVDTKIFRASGIRVVTSHSFEVLPKMLSHGRFDAFPRGIQQAWNDAQQFSNLGLEVEQELAFHYRLPSYFYLSPDSADLAKTLEKGLEALIASGEFDRFFILTLLLLKV
jgi:Bacterial extracellular solute-binding proteins, family 3.